MAATQAPLSAQSVDNMELWFQKIFSEIHLLKMSVDKTEGVFFFKKHVFSEEELLSSPSMRTITAMVGQIENLFESWLANSSIMPDRQKVYWDNRLRVERNLGELREHIIERKPTFWENILVTVTQFVRFVIKHLPLLPTAVLTALGIVFTEHQKQLGRVLDVDQDEL